MFDLLLDLFLFLFLLLLFHVDIILLDFGYICTALTQTSPRSASVSQSDMPGYIMSGDDWFVTDQHLVVRFLFFYFNLFYFYFILFDIILFEVTETTNSV